MTRLYTLTEDDVKTLRDLVAWSRRGISNTVNRPAPPIDAPSPRDVYIARAPAEGIPGMVGVEPPTTGSGSGTGTGPDSGFDNRPSGAECQVWRIIRGEQVTDVQETEFTRFVYNVSRSAIAGDDWLYLVQDEFGDWLGVPVNGTPAPSTVVTADSVVGSGTSVDPVELDGDVLSPGSFQAYCTGFGGVKTWFDNYPTITDTVNTSADSYTITLDPASGFVVDDTVPFRPTVTIQPANGSQWGIVDNGTQSWDGPKTFTSILGVRAYAAWIVGAIGSECGYVAGQLVAGTVATNEAGIAEMTLTVSLNGAGLPAGAYFSVGPQVGQTGTLSDGSSVTGGLITNISQTNLEAKLACAYASTVPLPANTYANGTLGVGATLTATSNGPLVVDGTTFLVATYTGLRVLVAGEATAANNGWYVVTQVGVAAVSPYILTRATDSDQASEIGPGYLTAVEAPVGLTPGATNNQKVFISIAASTFIVGTSSLTFVSVGNTYVADETTLTLTGNTFSIKSQTGTGSTVVMSVSPAMTGTPTAPTASVDTNTTQLATTAFVVAQAGASTPAANSGSGTVGTSTRFSRDDHAHPAVTGFTSNTKTNYTGTGTTALVTVFTVTNSNGLHGSFSVKNTHVSNGLTYKVTAVDMYGTSRNSGNVPVPVGNVATFNFDSILSTTTAGSPNSSVTLEVVDTVADGAHHATYDVYTSIIG